MRVPLGWLREYLDLDITSDAIAARLAMLGFPVEGIERRVPLSGILAGRILRVVKHPDADRLWVCTIDVGEPAPLTIATAATNVAEGQTVPVALIGAKLVGLEIAPRKMRGVDSQGMLISAEEIGLPGEWFEDGILQLDAGVQPATDLVALYNLNDDVLEVEVTANRVDVMSMLGVARELGAAFGRVVRDPVAYAPIATRDARDGETDGLRVSLETSDCRRYVAQRFTGPVPGISPMWMRIRLALAGQRPINNVVDITNYVMLETGQPIHAFDRQTLAGERCVARDARDGEALETLDGVQRTLTPAVMVIADDAAASSIAGVIGGAPSQVRPLTRDIVIESANFAPARVRRSARLLGVRTDASSRHERALSLAMPDIGSARTAALLESAGWTAASTALAVGASYAQPPAIAISGAMVTALLGFDIGDDEAAGALRALGFEVESRAGELLARPPVWRTDVTGPADVVEEVARIIGYDRVPSTVPPVFDHAISSEAYDREANFAATAASLGFHEAITFSLQPEKVRRMYERAGLAVPQGVEVQNPLSADQRWLRFSLLPALLEIAARTRGGDEARLFEIGHVFSRGNEGPVETPMAALLSVQPSSGALPWRDDGFLAIKEDALALVRALTGSIAGVQVGHHSELHPGKTALLESDGTTIATVGALNPKLTSGFGLKGQAYAALFEIDRLPRYRLPSYQEPSRFPAIERDLAMILAPNILARDIVAAVRAAGERLVRDVRVFDEYHGAPIADGKKSVAVRLTLQRTDATLTDKEADAAITRLLAELERTIGATLRT